MLTLLTLLATHTLQAGIAPSGDYFLRAGEDPLHQLVLYRADGAPVVLPRLKRLEGGESMEKFGDIAIAADGQAVGWLAYFGNCCTSYPIPLRVEVYKDGRRHTFEPAIVAWHWCFMDGAGQVAAVSSTVHGPRNEVFELWDLASGERRDSFHWLDGETHPDAPAWVLAVRDTHAGRVHLCWTR